MVVSQIVAQGVVKSLSKWPPSSILPKFEITEKKGKLLIFHACHLRRTLWNLKIGCILSTVFLFFTEKVKKKTQFYLKMV